MLTNSVYDGTKDGCLLVVSSFHSNTIAFVCQFIALMYMKLHSTKRSRWVTVLFLLAINDSCQGVVQGDAVKQEQHAVLILPIRRLQTTVAFRQCNTADASWLDLDYQRGVRSTAWVSTFPASLIAESIGLYLVSPLPLHGPKPDTQGTQLSCQEHGGLSLTNPDISNKKDGESSP